MSRQSKAAKRKILAQGITKMHLAGNRGPATTQAKHGKKYENTLNYKRKLAAKAAKQTYLEKLQGNEGG